MTLIKTNGYEIIKILNDFVNDKIVDNIQEVINNLTQKDFEFSIKTYKYESSIDIHTAKRIINFQNSINGIVKYCLKRNLSQIEKEKIIVEFNISKGCTEERLDNILNKIKGMLDMLPEKDRLTFLIAILITFCFYYFIGYKNNELEYNEKIKDKEIILKAMDKLSNDDNNNLINIIKQMDKNNLNELEYNEKITINEQDFTKNDISNIKMEKYPKQKIEKKVKTIKGNFKVIQINMKKHFIVIENDNEEMEKIFYDDNLFSRMQSFKEKFKQAIDDEGKIFYIEASFFENGNKKRDLILGKIEEINKN